MYKNPNAAAIAQARNEVAKWRNDSGPTYYPPGFHDMGNKVYHDPGRQGVEVSLPHILQVAITGGATLTVNLFGANRNYIAANFGNNVNITVTYTNSNPLVPYTYGDLLANIMANPIQVGITRVQAITQNQATAILSLTRSPGVGKVEAINLVPLVYPNQYINTITYVEYAYKIDQYTLLQYSQNGTTDASVLMYFYANQNINIDRAFSNERVVSEYAKPQTGIAQQMEVVSARGVGAPVARAQHLL